MQYILFIILFLMVSNQCFAQTLEKKDDNTFIETTQVERTIDDVKSQISGLEAEIASLEHEKESIQVKIDSRQKTINELDEKITEVKKLGVTEVSAVADMKIVQ